MGASVIIPCYLLPDNDRELTGWTLACIKSCRQHCPDAELVIVDNGSQVDGCMLRHHADLLIVNRHNLGYAPAVNQGLKLARGEWLVASNNDIELLDDWIETAIDAWDANTGIVCSHLEDHDPHHRAGRQVIPSEGFFFGALWMTHRDVIERIGYVSEEYELGYYEDKDFCLTAMAAGYEVVKVGWCKHIGNATSGKLPELHEMFMRNKERFDAKWGK